MTDDATIADKSRKRMESLKADRLKREQAAREARSNPVVSAGLNGTPVCTITDHRTWERELTIAVTPHQVDVIDVLGRV